MDDAEDGGARPDAEGERHQDGQGERGRPGQRTNRESKVLGDLVHGSARSSSRRPRASNPRAPVKRRRGAANGGLRRRGGVPEAGPAVPLSAALPGVSGPRRRGGGGAGRAPRPRARAAARRSPGRPARAARGRARRAVPGGRPPDPAGWPPTAHGAGRRPRGSRRSVGRTASARSTTSWDSPAEASASRCAEAIAAGLQPAPSSSEQRPLVAEQPLQERGVDAEAGEGEGPRVAAGELVAASLHQWAPAGTSWSASRSRSERDCTTTTWSHTRA